LEVVKIAIERLDQDAYPGKPLRYLSPVKLAVGPSLCNNNKEKGYGKI
jgi:hypothetical protein